MKPISIPQRIDDPPHLLLWRADELAPLLFGLVLGVLCTQVLLCLLAGFVLTHCYKRLRENRPDGYFLHLLYWFGLFVSRASSLRNPFIRHYLP
jgi:conjugal transfer pilus assembly protein TraL